jgi:hypothetical protein
MRRCDGAEVRGKTLRYGVFVALRDISREQVLAAIAEYNRLDRDESPGRYGLDPEPTWRPWPRQELTDAGLSAAARSARTRAVTVFLDPGREGRGVEDVSTAP